MWEGRWKVQGGWWEVDCPLYPDQSNLSGEGCLLIRGLRVMETSEINHVDRIFMDGFPCFLSVGLTEIFHKNINLQEPESWYFMLSFSRLYSASRSCRREIGKKVIWQGCEKASRQQANFILPFPLCIINSILIFSASQHATSCCYL